MQPPESSDAHPFATGDDAPARQYRTSTAFTLPRRRARPPSAQAYVHYRHEVVELTFLANGLSALPRPCRRPIVIAVFIAAETSRSVSLLRYRAECVGLGVSIPAIGRGC
jgi:hypothetical protein